MLGNVWEHCQDWHNREQIHKAVRGGSYHCYPTVSNCAYRSAGQLTSAGSDVGFRVIVLSQ